ncbi:MAG: phosphoenolpyruvate carboxykinase, partial [Pseudomonadota bacterium]
MEELGTTNPNNRLEAMGFQELASVRYNLTEAELYEEAIRNGEAVLTAHGALRALTGQHTGRSPKDKFVVSDDNTKNRIWWDNNKALSPEQFALLKADMLEHARGKALFVQDLIGGADRANALPTRVITQYAWHSLFIRNLLIRPARETLTDFIQELTIIDLPEFKADPARHGVRSETVIACDLTNGLVLIGGTSYAGEMKKSVFTVLN